MAAPRYRRINPDIVLLAYDARPVRVIPSGRVSRRSTFAPGEPGLHWADITTAWPRGWFGLRSRGERDDRGGGNVQVPLFAMHGVNFLVALTPGPPSDLVGRHDECPGGV